MALRDLFASPEAHADPYVWAAALWAHALLGAALVLLTIWGVMP